MRRAIVAGAVLLSFVLLTRPAAAQTGTARGKVVDSQGHGIADATVRLEFQGEMTRVHEVETNERGEYTQVGMYPGLYRITASKDGFQPSVIDCRVTLGDQTPVPDISLKTLDEVAEEQGRPTEMLRKKFDEAVELARSGKLDEAEALFTELLAAAPSVPEIHVNIGFVQVQRQEWDKAEASFLKALELRPGDPGATRGLVQVYQATGRQDEAQALADKVAAENPDDANAQFNRAVLFVNSGKIPEAISAFEAALAADPTMAEAHYHLGTLLVGQDPTRRNAAPAYGEPKHHGRQQRQSALAKVPL